MQKGTEEDRESWTFRSAAPARALPDTRRGTDVSCPGRDPMERKKIKCQRTEQPERGIWKTPGSLGEKAKPSEGGSEASAWAKGEGRPN